MPGKFIITYLQYTIIIVRLLPTKVATKNFARLKRIRLNSLLSNPSCINGGIFVVKNLKFKV